MNVTVHNGWIEWQVLVNVCTNYNLTPTVVLGVQHYFNLRQSTTIMKRIVKSTVVRRTIKKAVESGMKRMTRVAFKILFHLARMSLILTFMNRSY
jgi:hypothetical protein